ncbi:MAG: fibronectin type III domain-containing protein, partial [Bacteroidales bacterium]|nr:fibronectin type III domain-containing protein [Bacteroidales bacterium]
MHKFLRLLALAAMMVLPFAATAQGISLPYFHDFDGDATGTSAPMPAGWARINDATGTYTYYPYVMSSAANAHSGSNVLYFYLTTTTTYASNEYAIMPVVAEGYAMSDLELMFWAKRSTNATDLYVGVMSDPTAASTFVPVDTIALTTDQTEYTVSLASYAGTGRYVAFKMSRGTAATYCYMDDVTLRERRGCATPDSVAVGSLAPTSAVVSWAAGTANAWTLYRTVAGVTDSEACFSPSYTYTDLLPNTTYEVSVAAECADGQSYASYPVAFHTPCVALPADSLPYTYGFEDATATGTNGQISACWSRHVMNSATNYPYPSTTQVHSGSYALYFYNNAATAASRIVSWATMPLTEVPVNSLQLSFWALKTSANYGNLTIGVMDNPDDLSTFDTITSIQVADNSTWEYFEIPLSSYTGTGHHLALLSAAAVLSYTYLDDVTIDLLPTCTRPTEAAASNVTQTSADLSWTETGTATEWLVQYTTTDFETGTVVTENAIATPYTLTGLSPSTSYQVRIAALCDNGDTSTFTNLSLQTECGQVELPYFYSFENDATGSSAPFVYCWTRHNDATGTVNYYPYVSSNSANAHSGMRYLYFYTSTTTTYANNMYAVLPGVNTGGRPMSSLEMLFWTKLGSATSTEKIIVGVMSSPDSVETFVPIDSVTVTGNVMTQYTISFANYTGTNNYIALLVRRGTTSSNIYVDDIEVRRAANCHTAEGMHLVSVTDNEATISWNSNGQDGFNVYYGEAGFDADTAMVDYVSDTTYTFYGLAASTAYEYYIVATCGGDEAHATSRFGFTTECTPIDSLPYFEGFDSYATGTSATIDPCWHKYTNYSTAYPYPIAAGAVHGANGLTFRADRSSSLGTAPTYCYAALPRFTAPLAQLCLRFNAKRYSSIGETYHSEIQVGVMSDPEDYSTFVPVTFIDLTPEAASSVHAEEVFFDGYHGTGEYIAIVDPSPSGLGHYNYFYIDDVEVDFVPNCHRSTNLAATNVTANSADLAWHNGSATLTGFTVAYSQQADFDPDTCGQTFVVTDTTATLTGLDNYSTYYWAVAADCGDEQSEWSRVASFMTLYDCGEGFTNIIDTIGQGTSSTSTYTMYCSTTYPSGYSTNIFGVEELAAMGLQSNNRINRIKLHCGATGATISDVDVYMTETDLNAFGNPAAGDTVAVGSMTHVFHGNVVATPNQWVEIVFDSAFQYSGSRNLMVTLRRGITTASATFYYTSASPDYRTCYGYRTATGTTYSATRSYSRTNMVFNICAEEPACERPADVALTSLMPNAADIAWTGSAARYEVAYGEAGFNPDTVSSLAGTHAFTTTTAYSIAGLNANTGYDVYVRSYCSTGDTSDWSIAFSFTTPCAAQSIPYTEDFEAYASGSTSTIDPCWVKGTNNTTQYPYPYLTNAISGVRSLYFYAYHPSSATSTQYYCYAALPLMEVPVDSLMLTFSMRRYNTTTDYYTTRMVVGVMTDPSDISTFDPVDTIDMKNEAGLAVRRYEVAFNNYHGNGQYIAFYDEVPPLYGSSTYSYSYAYVDDVNVDYIPTCPSPINVASSNVGAHEATITWTDRNANPLAWELEYGPTGFTPGYGTRLYPAADSIVLTGLNNATFYDVYVRNICAAGDTSGWSMIHTFNTVCGMISTLPYTNGFENEQSGGASITTYPQFVTCWTRFNNSGTVSYQGYPYVSTTTTYVHSGTKGMYFYAAAATTTTDYPNIQMAVMPQVDTTVFSMNNLKVSFFAKRNASYATTFLVGVMSDPTNAATFVAIDSVPLTDSYDFYEVPFNGYTGNGSYVAFRLDRGAAIQYAYLDDVELDIIPTCVRPDDLVADSATSNSILLSWTETGTASQWAVEYGPEGFMPGTGTSVVANSNPFRLTGLTPATHYQAYVRAICQEGDTSYYNRVPVVFTTSQIPAAVPYFYDFENATEWSNWQTNTNTNVNWYRGIVEGSNRLYVSADNGATVGTNLTQIVNAVAYRDIDFGNTPNTFAVTFKAKCGGSTDGNYDGVSVLLVDPTLPVEASSTAITTPWGHINDVSRGTVRRDTTWTEYTFYLDNAVGVRRLVFYWFNQATSSTHPYMGGPAVIDSVSVYQQACDRPYDLEAVNITQTTATLTWAGIDGDTYEVRYRPVDGPSNIYTIDTTNALYYNVAGLTGNTDYYFWVRKLCSATSLSAFSASSRFTTECGAYFASDTLYEDFHTTEGAAYNVAGTLPNCWEGYSNGTNDLYLPHVVNSGTYWYTASDNNSIIMTSGSAAYGDTKIVRLPRFLEPVRSLTLSYWMCTESSTNGTLSVGYLTGDDMANDFVAVKSIPASTSTIHSSTGLQPSNGIYDTVTFDSVPANAKYIAFKWVYTTSFYSCCLDNIKVTSDEACPTPEIVVENHDYESATVTWSGVDTLYEVAFKESIAPVWPAAIAVTGNTYTFTGLQPATSYDFRVRQNCTAYGHDFSEWAEMQIMTDSMLCHAPDSLSLLAVTHNDVTLDWTPSGQETAWDVHVWFAGGFDTIYTVSSHPVTLGGLVPSVTYNAAVRTLCGNSQNIEGEWGDTITFTTLSCPSVTGLTADSVTASSVTLSWDNNAMAQSWTI